MRFRLFLICCLQMSALSYPSGKKRQVYPLRSHSPGREYENHYQRRNGNSEIQNLRNPNVSQNRQGYNVPTQKENVPQAYEFHPQQQKQSENAAYQNQNNPPTWSKSPDAKQFNMYSTESLNSHSPYDSNKLFRQREEGAYNQNQFNSDPLGRKMQTKDFLRTVKESKNLKRNMNNDRKPNNGQYYPEDNFQYQGSQTNNGGPFTYPKNKEIGNFKQKASNDNVQDKFPQGISEPRMSHFSNKMAGDKSVSDVKAPPVTESENPFSPKQYFGTTSLSPEYTYPTQNARRSFYLPAEGSNLDPEGSSGNEDKTGQSNSKMYTNNLEDEQGQNEIQKSKNIEYKDRMKVHGDSIPKNTGTDNPMKKQRHPFTNNKFGGYEDDNGNTDSELKPSAYPLPFINGHYNDLKKQDDASTTRPSSNFRNPPSNTDNLYRRSESSKNFDPSVASFEAGSLKTETEDFSKDKNLNNNKLYTNPSDLNTFYQNILGTHYLITPRSSKQFHISNFKESRLNREDIEKNPRMFPDTLRRYIDKNEKFARSGDKTAPILKSADSQNFNDNAVRENYGEMDEEDPALHLEDDRLRRISENDDDKIFNISADKSKLDRKLSRTIDDVKTKQTIIKDEMSNSEKNIIENAQEQVLDRIHIISRENPSTNQLQNRSKAIHPGIIKAEGGYINDIKKTGSSQSDVQSYIPTRDNATNRPGVLIGNNKEKIMLSITKGDELNFYQSEKPTSSDKYDLYHSLPLNTRADYESDYESYEVERPTGFDKHNFYTEESGQAFNGPLRNPFSEQNSFLIKNKSEGAKKMKNLDSPSNNSEGENKVLSFGGKINSDRMSKGKLQNTNNLKTTNTYDFGEYDYNTNLDSQDRPEELVTNNNVKIRNTPLTSDENENYYDEMEDMGFSQPENRLGEGPDKEVSNSVSKLPYQIPERKFPSSYIDKDKHNYNYFRPPSKPNLSDFSEAHPPQFRPPPLTRPESFYGTTIQKAANNKDNLQNLNSFPSQIGMNSNYNGQEELEVPKMIPGSSSFQSSTEYAVLDENAEFERHEKLEKESKILLRNNGIIANESFHLFKERKADIKKNQASFHETYMEERNGDKFPNELDSENNKDGNANDISLPNQENQQSSNSKNVLKPTSSVDEEAVRVPSGVQQRQLQKNSFKIGNNQGKGKDSLRDLVRGEDSEDYENSTEEQEDENSTDNEQERSADLEENEDQIDDIKSAYRFRSVGNPSIRKTDEILSNQNENLKHYPEDMDTNKVLHSISSNELSLNGAKQQEPYGPFLNAQSSNDRQQALAAVEGDLQLRPWVGPVSVRETPILGDSNSQQQSSRIGQQYKTSIHSEEPEPQFLTSPQYSLGSPVFSEQYPPVNKRPANGRQQALAAVEGDFRLMPRLGPVSVREIPILGDSNSQQQSSRIGQQYKTSIYSEEPDPQFLTSSQYLLGNPVSSEQYPPVNKQPANGRQQTLAAVEGDLRLMPWVGPVSVRETPILGDSNSQQQSSMIGQQYKTSIYSEEPEPQFLTSSQYSLGSPVSSEQYPPVNKRMEVKSRNVAIPADLDQLKMRMYQQMESSSEPSRLVPVDQFYNNPRVAQFDEGYSILEETRNKLYMPLDDNKEAPDVQSKASTPVPIGATTIAVTENDTTLLTSSAFEEKAVDIVYVPLPSTTPNTEKNYYDFIQIQNSTQSSGRTQRHLRSESRRWKNKEEGHYSNGITS